MQDRFHEMTTRDCQRLLRHSKHMTAILMDMNRSLDEDGDGRNKRMRVGSSSEEEDDDDEDM